jgi:hypothetical protein
VNRADVTYLHVFLAEEGVRYKINDRPMFFPVALKQWLFLSAEERDVLPCCFSYSYIFLHG